MMDGRRFIAPAANASRLAPARTGAIGPEAAIRLVKPLKAIFRPCYDAMRSLEQRSDYVIRNPQTGSCTLLRYAPPSGVRESSRHLHPCPA